MFKLDYTTDLDPLDDLTKKKAKTHLHSGLTCPFRRIFIVTNLSVVFRGWWHTLVNRHEVHPTWHQSGTNWFFTQRQKTALSQSVIQPVTDWRTHQGKQITPCFKQQLNQLSSVIDHILSPTADNKIMKETILSFSTAWSSPEFQKPQMTQKKKWCQANICIWLVKSGAPKFHAHL